MKFRHTVLALCCLTAGQSIAQELSLKDAFADKFRIGVALNKDQVYGKDAKALPLIKEHFNSMTAENLMKPEYLQPREGKFFFKDADQFIKFGEQNNMRIIGHTLVWHNQLPDWFFVDDKGNDVSREVLIARMKNHITTVVSRYKGRIYGWDVLNEPIEDDGTYRKSKFYEIIGPEYIQMAFEFAHAADPGAKLHINDYNLEEPQKRAKLIEIVKGLQEKGVQVDAVGVQGHFGLGFPSLQELETSIEEFSKLGVRIMISEVDITVLNTPNKYYTGAEVSLNYEYDAKLNPYNDGILPEKKAQQLTKRYVDLFRLFLKHKDVIDRVTLWGLTDADSWLNYWPIQGRTDYPMLFDRSYQPKPAVAEIIKLAQEDNQ